MRPSMRTENPKLYLVANAATLAGLLATVVGLARAFVSAPVAPPDQRSAELAKRIGDAMNPIAAGLFVAILCLVGAWLMERTRG